MEFLYPNVLWMMLLPVILLIFLITTNKSDMQLIFEKEVLKRLVVAKNGLDLQTRNVLIFTALVLMIIALSRPVVLQKEQELKQNLILVVLALDVSRSMQSTDIYPNRLELSKKKIKDFLLMSKNSAAGVVLFARSAFILSPVTQDFTTLLYMIENMDSGLNFDNGSNIMGMLESSNDLLKDYDSKNIIVLSDGGNNKEFEKEIEFAQKNNIKVYVIATATKSGSPIPTKNGYLTDQNGNIVTVTLNDNIKELALNSGGGYIDFTIDDADINAIIDELLNRSQKEQMDTKKIKIYTELFYYPLALGLVFLFVSIFSIPRIKQSSSLLILLTILFTNTTSCHAGLLDFKILEEAKQAYEKENFVYSSNQYKKVAKNSEGFYNLGNSLYKEGKYQEALKAYEKVVTSNKRFEAQKLHNMGNSYVKLSDLTKAKEMYENALKKHYDQETKENLDKVNNSLKQNMQNQGNEQEKQNNNEDSKDDQSSKNDQKGSNSSKQNSKDQKDQDSKKNQEDKKEAKEQDNQNKSIDKQEGKESSEKNKALNSVKEQNISDIEEKKWMELLKDRKTPVMLHKSENSSSKSGDGSTPW